MTLMTIRDIATIKEALKNDQIARHPYLRDYNELSVLSTLNETMAIQVQYVEDRAKNAIEGMSIWTATGADLNNLVQDRGITRQAGGKATGTITFRSVLPATETITILSGTVAKAAGPDGNIIYFETTEDGVIDVGDTSVIVDAQAVLPGTDGNVPTYAINQMNQYIRGVARIENTVAFTGGTEQESDIALRERYKYAIDINGKATKPLLEQRILDLETVRECIIWQRCAGEIELVADSTTQTTSIDTTICDCLEENMSVGIISRGKVLASIVYGVVSANLTVTEAGNIYVRVESIFISSNESITITYLNMSGASKTVVVTVPEGSVKGDIITAVMGSEFATAITNVLYIGSNSFNILGGLGTYPYLYILPRKVTANVTINIKQTTTPDPDLETKIEASVYAFLDAFHIGDIIEFSDLVQYIYMDYATKDTTKIQFDGIDQIQSVYITANGSTISSFGQTISIADDQRVDPGSVLAVLT